MLLLIPQRYEFSSKSQPKFWLLSGRRRCCWYHKGTNFQANHNTNINAIHNDQLLLIPQRYEFSSKSQHRIFLNQGNIVVADTTKVRIFKQITTRGMSDSLRKSCCWYHKGTNFQANHNFTSFLNSTPRVVADTTKVRIFKQITTTSHSLSISAELLLIPQRYEFSSKSQP